MQTVKTKVVKASWLGRKGVVTTFHFDKKSDGLRACYYEYEDGGICVTLIKGDGRHVGFEKFIEVTFTK